MTDEINSLREALAFSPNNIKLRALIATKLFTLGQYEEAEAEYRAAMRLSPETPELQQGLAETFLAQGKDTYAVLLTENLVRKDPSPEQLLLHARALRKTGKPDEAGDFYVQAIRENRLLATPELAAIFGMEKDENIFSLAVAGGDDDRESELPDDDSSLNAEKPKIRFADIGGMESVKESIRMKIIYPLQNKDMFAAYGKKTGGGVLFYGPPGCGKTLIARATAGEVRAHFVSVGLHDVLDMYTGNSEQNLHAIFENARRNAPCVLFFDEVDALAAKRSDMRQSGGRHVINQFLSEMDGVNGDNEGVLVLAATNAPWYVDTAFRRPGRFDRVVFISPPDAKAREAIWRIHLTGKPTKAIDYRALAVASKGFSGADIAQAVDACIEEKLSEAMRVGQAIPLSMPALLATVRKTKPTTVEWFTSAKNYAVYANESGAYDDILEYLNKKHD